MNNESLGIYKITFQRLILIIFLFIGMFIFPTISIISFYEYYEVDIKKNVAQYPFGVAEAIAEGGEHYASAEKYAQTALLDGFLFALISLFFYLAVYNLKYRVKFGILTMIILAGYLWISIIF